MTALQGYYNAGDGKTWRLAYSLNRLCAEVAVRWPDITNLGGRGDVGHGLMNLQSDHNPFVKKPDGSSPGIVRAVDFGGPYDQLMQLRAHLYALGANRFGPLWPYGYLKGPDSHGCAWPIGTGWNTNTGDEGHLHVSVTQTDGWNPVAGTAGYVPAIDSTESWGIADGTGLTGLALSSTPLEEDEMNADEVAALTQANANAFEARKLAGANATALAAVQVTLAGVAADAAEARRIAGVNAGALPAAGNERTVAQQVQAVLDAALAKVPSGQSLTSAQVEALLREAFAGLAA